MRKELMNKRRDPLPTHARGMPAWLQSLSSLESKAKVINSSNDSFLLCCVRAFSF